MAPVLPKPHTWMPPRSAKVALACAAVSAGLPQALCDTAATDPLAQVTKLLDDLMAQIIADGEKEAMAYREFFQWCQDVSFDKTARINKRKALKEAFEAKISKATSDAKIASDMVEELAGSISKDEAELKEATKIRDGEAAAFVANEEQLMESIDTLSRALVYLQKQQGSASFAQLMSASSTVGALTTFKAVIDAASLEGVDHSHLAALLQQKEKDKESQRAAAKGGDDDDYDLDDKEDASAKAPAAAGYESKSGGILDTLEDLKEDAEDQLANLRKAEADAAQNYDMLKSSLRDSITHDTSGAEQQKGIKAAALKLKAESEAEWALAKKDYVMAQKNLGVAHSNCMVTAADHETSTLARTHELTVLAQAKKILKESTGGGASAASFLQVRSSSTTGTRVWKVQNKVSTMIKALAGKYHSSALAQLASRCAAAARFGSMHGADPYAKVKGLINQLIEKLEAKAQEEASEKAYCDEQMSKTSEKQSELKEDVEKLITKIDKGSGRSGELKEEIIGINGELASLAELRAQLDAERKNAHEAYVEAKTNLNKAISGVRTAIDVLSDYYGEASSASLLQDKMKMKMQLFTQTESDQPAVPQHSKSSGAGGSVIGVLDVLGSDFAQGLEKIELEEADSVSEYKLMMTRDEVTKVNLDQDVTYKVREVNALDKFVADLSADLATQKEELSAVDAYFAKVKARCVAAPNPYEERARKRAAETNGLKEALEVLESETAFLQTRRQRRRGNFLEARGA